ncbi:amidase signature domain-containing protein [Leptodontidium sp. 2 PMI_412]|nr:amidase signature domain-containing protein [Leptodontidium sp. 2 PMI_412]
MESASLATATNDHDFNIVEASIADLSTALDEGKVTSVELVAKYLHRIAVYDRRGKLNSIPLLNLSVFEDAAKSDQRRADGLPVRPLEGIPFTAKDSYKVKGMTVASGSPAFKNLVANEDAFTVGKLRDAGAVLIGKTNMPPMAAGGMQRGQYGRAESPYNPEYLTAAFASGSSNGSATSTAASFSAFGMAEETVSSGRSPASNNGLVAYTPSRGLISIRGNWPLYATCDVVVPHTRTVRDMFKILDVIVVEDECTMGDFWRNQPFVKLPQISGPNTRPASFKSLENVESLAGKRIGVPRMYIGQSENLNNPISTRQSILDLWHRARRELESLGATVIETDFPLMEKYDTVSSASTKESSKVGRDSKGNQEPKDGITPEWNLMERRELVAYAWDDFLLQNNDPGCPNLSSVDPAEIFPLPTGALSDRYTRLGAPIQYSTIVDLVSKGRGPINELPGLEAALHALEGRRAEFESWLQFEELDAIVFPANGDVGRADTDTNPDSAEAAWRNGVLYSNGNRVLRHFGIPTVTVPMGIMEDTKMPVGLTFAGKGYDDSKLLEYAFAYEARSKNRKAPEGTPVLSSDLMTWKGGETGNIAPSVTIEVRSQVQTDGHPVRRLGGSFDVDRSGGLQRFDLTVDGQSIAVSVLDGGRWEMDCDLEVQSLANKAEIDKQLVIALVVGRNGRAGAKLLLLD